MEHYLSLAVKSIFVENILLSFFLGMCSYLAISKKIEPSIGLGFAVIFVNGLWLEVYISNWFIRKKTIRKIIFTEDKRVSRSAILPTKNNKNQGTNVQRQIEHSH